MSKASKKLSYEKQQKNIKFTNEGVLHNQENYYVGAFAGTDILQTFNSDISMEIQSLNQQKSELEFDIKGIEAPFANALRRIMIAEIPTMAIHKVSMFQNTSVIPDEVLCHRLGLIPIKADAYQFDDKTEEDEATETNSIQFSINIRCRRKKQYKNKTDKELENIAPEEYLENAVVYSSDLKWVPIGNQSEKFQSIRPVHEKIIVAKLRENQEIIADLVCIKGIGRNHAKWSPVCTAYYKLMNDIKINKSIKGESAENLKKKCPMGVFDVENNKAVVANPRNCTICRECIRDVEEFQEKIELGKDKQHYIFTVESVGIYEPQVIVKHALDMLKQKALSYKIE